MSESRRVLMSEDLFLELGASRVDWGEPDQDGFYTPTLYADTVVREGKLDVERLARAIRPHVRGYNVFPERESRLVRGEYELLHIKAIAAEYARLTRQPEGQR